MDSNRRDFLKKSFVATLVSFIPFKLKAQITLDCELSTPSRGKYFESNTTK